MAGIFPPAAQGGVPPGAGVENGYDPANNVIGEGPLYCSSACTTVLTVGQLNALTSEIAAAVDRLGRSYNTGIVTNLGDALATLAVSLVPAGGTPGQALVKNSSNVPAWGVPIDCGVYG